MHRHIKCLVLGLIVVSPSFTHAQESAIPQEIRDELSFLVGSWTTEGEYNGEKITGEYTAEWNHGHNCLILNIEYAGLKSTGICGWNPLTNEIVETWYRPDGLAVVQRYSVVSSTKWEGTVMLIDASGKRSAGSIVLNKIDDSKFTFTGDAQKTKLTTINTKTK